MNHDLYQSEDKNLPHSPSPSRQNHFRSTMHPFIKNQQLFSIMNNILADQHSNPEDILEDFEGEQETIACPELDENAEEEMDVEDGRFDNNTEADIKEHTDKQSVPVGIPSLWRETITHAAKGVTDDTHRAYLRLANACACFLLDKKLITHQGAFFSKTPLPYSDEMIIAWIMDSCDTIGLDGKPAQGARGTYAHAQKMRASMTHMFGRILGIGSMVWKQEPLADDDEHFHIEGNPSISEKLSAYMVGLRRRKVQIGETATSARAITHQIMERLYDFNHRPENWNLQPPGHPNSTQKKSNIHQWGGPLHRRAAQAIYSIAYLCMLRVDEVLKIKTSHISVDCEKNTVTLTLPFRKTHQFGEIKPFVLYKFPDEEAYLCPVRALTEWIAASRVTSGYVFRRMTSDGRPFANDNAMTSEKFLETFRHNLIDIGIEPSPYGTHSFRRGGCQYFSSVRRWKLRRICDWGGWSSEFSSLTIVKYLISWNDEPEESREDFLNPDQKPSTLCYHCGRSCHCA